MTALCTGVVLDLPFPSRVAINMPMPDPTLWVVPVQGIPGADSTVPGPPGPPGQPGTPGSAPQAYHHDQGTPSTSWLIHHNLGYNPAGVVVHDSGGTEWEGVVTYLDVNTARIDFDVAFGGEADLS